MTRTCAFARPRVLSFRACRIPDRLSPRCRLEETRAYPLPARCSRGSMRIGALSSRSWKTAVKYEGQRYRSLSAIARQVTGTRWNGRLFFGIAERRRA